MLLLTGVLNWKDCLQYPPAWDTLFWFAVLVGMSGRRHSRCCEQHLRCMACIKTWCNFRAKYQSPASTCTTLCRCASSPAMLHLHGRQALSASTAVWHHFQVCLVYSPAPSSIEDLQGHLGSAQLGSFVSGKQQTKMLCKSIQRWILWHAGQLNSMGVIKHFADVVGGKLVEMNLGWQAVFGLLNVAYFLLHYMFASQTAHVGALYSAFLAMMLTAGTIPVHESRCDFF